ncbi:hypothetical protein [Noviherbaspirillum sedimenti]|uniref:hypothetical protein n=1 Tax=Noviherbaspirillum sedimenti TaxID=2320865 RepID=UPI00131484A8|nr:hypothetical protein [Noviherbaspirillum sedimenti]
MTRKKESAGGFDTNTADTKHTSKIISFCTRCKSVFIRLAQVLATFFRGLA